MTTLVIILAIVAATSVVALFLTSRQHPEQAASHGPRDEPTTSEELYGSADRPAGPGAEAMDPDRLGGDRHPPT